MITKKDYIYNYHVVKNNLCETYLQTFNYLLSIVDGSYLLYTYNIHGFMKVYRNYFTLFVKYNNIYT